MAPLVYLVLVLAVGLVFSASPVLDYPKTCPQTTSMHGATWPTRYYANDCMVPAVLNASRGGSVLDINMVLMSGYVGSLGDVMTSAEPLMAMAAQEIEDSALLPGYRVKFTLADSRCTGPDASAATIRVMTERPVKHGMIGDSCTGSCTMISDSIQNFNVLTLSPGCTGTELSVRTRFPYFVRLSPSTRLNVEACHRLAKYFQRRRVGILLSPKSIMVSAKDVFLGLVAADVKNGAYNWTVLLTKEVATKAQARDAIALVKERDSRFILNLMYQDEAALSLCAMFQAGMASPDYWMMAGTGSYNADFDTLFAGITDCTRDQIFEAGYGMIEIIKASMVPIGVHGLSGRRNAEIISDYASACQSFAGGKGACGSAMSGYFYDGMWHFATIMHQHLVKEGGAHANLTTRAARQRLFDLSLQLSYQGLTGRVRQFNGVDPVTDADGGSLGDREGPLLLRQFVGISPLSRYSILGYYTPSETVWQNDVVFSRNDSSKRLQCSGNSCAFSDSFVPSDRSSGCSSGFLWSVALGCTPCPAGTYAELGTSECSRCSLGSFSNTAGQSACSACSAGRFAKMEAATACTQCGTGTSASEEGSGTCTRCPVGTFASSMGLSNCAKCKEPLTTEFPGAITETECICPSGFFLEVGSTTCAGCKEGMVCEIGSDMHYFSQGAVTGPVPKLEPRYWSSAAEPLNVFQCRSAFSCPGGLPGTCGAQLEGRACAHCLEGFYWNGDRCTECGRSLSTPALFPLVPILIGFALPVIQYKISSKPYEKWGSKVAAAGAVVFVLLNHYQIIAIIGSAEVDAPMTMERSYKVWSFTNEINSVFKTQCNSMANIRDLMVVKAFTPLIIGIMTLIDYLVAIMVDRVTNKVYFRMEPDRLFNGFGSLMFTFFGAVVAMSVELWKCMSNPNGQRTMFSDASVICFESDDWIGMLAISVLAVMVYVIFGGLVMVWAIVKAKSKFADKGFRTRWKFLFEKYRLGAWWFGLAFLAKNICVNLAFVILPLPSFQFYFVAFVVGAYLVLILLVWPYRAHWPNWVEMVCCSCVCLSCMFIASFTFLQEADDIEKQTVSNLAVVVSWWPLVMGGLLAIYLRVFSFFKKFNLFGIRSRHAASKEALEKEAVKVQEMFGILSSVSKEELLTLYEQTGEYEHWLMRHVYLVLGGELTGVQDAAAPAKRSQISTGRTLSRRSERQSSVAVLQGPKKDAYYTMYL